MITKETYKRYSRQMLLEPIGIQGQEKIMQAKVLVIGAGGLGCPVLQYLAAAGVGKLGIVDFDTVELHNLPRQILHTAHYLNQLKTTSALAMLQVLNPLVSLQTFSKKLTAANASPLLSDFDIVVDGSDNFETRYLVNDTCVLLNKPLVYGSILNFEGQLAVFNHKGSKNLRDLFPEPPDPKEVPNCGLNGVLGTLPGIIGTMMAHETLKLITGLPVLENALVIFDTLHFTWTRLDL